MPNWEMTQWATLAATDDELSLDFLSRTSDSAASIAENTSPFGAFPLIWAVTMSKAHISFAVIFSYFCERFSVVNDDEWRKHEVNGENGMNKNGFNYLDGNVLIDPEHSFYILMVSLQSQLYLNKINK